jgi:hypothetical protein
MTDRERKACDALKATLEWLGLTDMTNEKLLKAIDAGLDDQKGIGKGNARLTLKIRDSLADYFGSERQDTSLALRGYIGMAEA